MSDFDESSTPSLDPKSPQSYLRTRIAAVLKAHPDLISGKCHGIEEPELQFDHQDQWLDHVADVLISELPELQPCPFCGLSHNRCDCLRTTADD